MPLQTFMLGLMFVGIAIVSDSGYALLAGTAGNWLKKQSLVSPVSALRQR